MPLYDARGEENRGRRHRAVLIGVEHYQGSRNDLPAVATNLRLMREALTAEGTGMLRPEDLVVIPAVGGSAATVDQIRVREALADARRDVTGLLVVYFAGHGIVRTDGSDLNLMFTEAQVTRDRRHPFADTLSWRDDIMPELRKARADWVVVILDCCFAGNALADFNPVSGQNFALLTAAEPGVEIPPGDPRTGTEFTAAFHRLLTTGKGGPVTFTSVVTGIREAMAPLRAVDGHPWVPDELRHGDDVVLALAADTPRPIRKPRWWRMRPRALKRTTALVAAVLVALVGLGTVYVLHSTGDEPCALPLQLRVLTDPDLRETVQSAADAYSERGGDGCRTVGIDVYDAKSTDAVEAFRSSSLWQEPPATCPATGDCLRPQRDIGAQPDIWIPAAGSAWQRAAADGAGGASTSPASTSSASTSGVSAAAKARNVVELDRLGSVAYTPMVLGVPDTVPLPLSLQAGQPLDTLVSGLKGIDDVEILRPDPEATEGALLATEALYRAPHSGGAGMVEQRMAEVLRPMPSSAQDLMCALAKGTRGTLEDYAAVFVPEQTVARFNLSANEPGRPGCATEALRRRVAYYPSDVPMLDLPFVRVTWAGADRDAHEREAAVRAFHAWLTTDPRGQGYFTRDGFRGVAQDGAPATPVEGSTLRYGDNGRSLLAHVPETGESAAAASLNGALHDYRDALGPGKVLYLLDNSSSTADKRVWDGTGGLKELVVRSMSALGARDSLGVWMAAVDDGAPPTQLVMFEPGGGARAQGAVAGAKTADVNARIADGLTRALKTLRQDAADTQEPRLLVVMTDGEDFDAVTEKDQEDLVSTAGGEVRVRIVTVSLRNGACAPGSLGDRLARASAGRCLDPADDIAAGLSAEVAKTGTGDAE
ncbi:substrate-binding domain-containing protein [Streptomyces sp. NBC_01218]|uniref:substrate-binding domain-containing protein n=1 Tax=Streptomyces sp. NBC_01218 TaxID=2903780 RepID=UPI002E0ED2C3|nr:substrate-binding domain-containing protein [Streptomyces sp. NBC_01218]